METLLLDLDVLCDNIPKQPVRYSATLLSTHRTVHPTVLFTVPEPGTGPLRDGDVAVGRVLNDLVTAYMPAKPPFHTDWSRGDLLGKLLELVEKNPDGQQFTLPGDQVRFVRTAEMEHRLKLPANPNWSYLPSHVTFLFTPQGVEEETPSEMRCLAEYAVDVLEGTVQPLLFEIRNLRNGLERLQQKHDAIKELHGRLQATLGVETGDTTNKDNE